MTRGYTLGILLTLLNEDRPLGADEIFTAYRGGEGLGWIMRHRLGGLGAAGLLRKDGNQLILTPGRGMLVVRLYRVCIATLGLRKTG